VYLVAGLGNPGREYEGNRHNVGFMLVDLLAERWSSGPFREKFKGEFAKTSYRGEEVVLLEPMTYMNLSGESVQRAMAFFKVPLEKLVVVHDELDLPFGTFRIKLGGGAAGHKGLKSITQHCGGDGYARVRVGIDRPAGRSTESYVLSDFPASDRAELPDLLVKVADAVQCIVREGPQVAMNRYHRSPPRKGRRRSAAAPEPEGGQTPAEEPASPEEPPEGST